MASVILTGADRVKSVIVRTGKAVSAFGVFPNPILKRLLDNFLLCLCRRSFLVVEYCLFVAVFVVNIVKDTHITQIQRVLDNTIGGSPLCTVGAVRLDISVIGTLILNKPVAVYRRIAYLDSACRIARWGQQLYNKPLNILLRYPSSTKPHGDFARTQILWNNLFECFGVDYKLWVCLCRRFCNHKFIADIARQVFVCGHIFCRLGLGYFKDNAL